VREGRAIVTFLTLGWVTLRGICADDRIGSDDRLVGRVVSDLRSIQKRSFVITIKDKIGLYVAKIGASAAATAASWKTSLRLLYELVAKYWQKS